MNPNEHSAGRAHLTEGHQEALVAADTLFGAFCVLMLAVSTFGWYNGEIGPLGPIAILVFLLANFAISQVSLVVKNAYSLEIGRFVVGGIICPAAYLLTDGPMAAWWPGFLIMCLGGCVMLGLLTGKTFWGRLLVVFYAANMLVATLFGIEDVDWYAFAVNVGVVAMVGGLFTTIMSILGQTLQRMADQSEELRVARDALFAEVEVAQEIQTLLLPSEPKVPDHVVSGRMIPAEEVGGDYYDVVTVRGRAFLAIGDVSGHGVTAGLTMMMARSSLLGAIEANPEASLTEIYRVLNRCLVRNLSRMAVQLYMTFNLVEYLGHGKFSVVGLHLPLIVYRKESGTIEEVECPGIWLGILDDITVDVLPEKHFDMAEGDLIVLYTDGILETFRGKEMFGMERLHEAVRGSADDGPEGVINAILAALKAFTDERAEDDVTLLVVNHRGTVAAA